MLLGTDEEEEEEEQQEEINLKKQTLPSIKYNISRLGSVSIGVWLICAFNNTQGGIPFIISIINKGVRN